MEPPHSPLHRPLCSSVTYFLATRRAPLQQAGGPRSQDVPLFVSRQVHIQREHSLQSNFCLIDLCSKRQLSQTRHESTVNLIPLLCEPLQLPCVLRGRKGAPKHEGAAAKRDVAEAERAPLSLEQAGDGLDLRPLILCNLSALDLLAHIKAQIQRIIVAWLDLSTRSVVRPNIAGHAAFSLGDELDRSDQLGRLVPVF